MSGTAKPLNALLSASMDYLLVLVVSARPVPEVLAGAAALRCAVEQLPGPPRRPARTGGEPFVACSDHHDSSSRAGRPKRSKLANSRFGSIGSSTQRPYDWVAGMSVARTTNATTSLIFSPRNVRTFSANGR